MSCAKCGHSTILGPFYRDGRFDPTGRESLEYRCACCGYTYSTDCNDRNTKDYAERKMEELRKKEQS